jgi:hypothetical protein
MEWGLDCDRKQKVKDLVQEKGVTRSCTRRGAMYYMRRTCGRYKEHESEKRYREDKVGIDILDKVKNLITLFIGVLRVLYLSNLNYHP